MLKVLKNNKFYLFLSYFILMLITILSFNSNIDNPYKFHKEETKQTIKIIKDLGDVNQFTPHIFSLSILVLNRDITGLFLYSKILATSLISTYVIKYSIKRVRPNKANYSFPSGHSSFTFISFIFILFRFNFIYSILPLICTMFVGYSRILSNYHYISDVFGGFLLSLFINHLFFTLTKTKKISSNITIKKLMLLTFLIVLFNIVYFLYLLY